MVIVKEGKGFKITRGDQEYVSPYPWQEEAVLDFLRKYGTEDEIKEQVLRIVSIVASNDIYCDRYTIFDTGLVKDWRKYSPFKHIQVWYAPSEFDKEMELIHGEAVQTGVNLHPDGTIFWIPTLITEQKDIETLFDQINEVLQSPFKRLSSNLVDVPTYAEVTYNFPTISWIVRTNTAGYIAHISLLGYTAAVMCDSLEEAKSIAEVFIRGSSGFKQII